MSLEQDSNGFLVGTVITDIKRSRKNSDELLIQVKKIADLLKQQGHLQSGNADNSSSNANSDAGSQQRARRQRQRNNGGDASNSNQSETSDSASSELNGDSEHPEQRRRESLRQKRERQRLERQQLRLSQQEQQADSQADLTQNPPIPPTPSNSDDEQPSNSGNSRQRDSRGRFTSDTDNGSPDAIIAGDDIGSNSRDSRGRFTGGSNGGRVNLDKYGAGGVGGGIGGLISGLGDRITSAIIAGQDLQEVDPTIKAFSEIAEPLQRGYQFIFSGTDKKDKPYFAWFNKIWKSLKKTEDNTADNGDDNSSGDSGGGLLGWAVPLLMTALGFIAPIALGIGAAALAAWGLFSASGREFFMNLGTNIAAAWQWSVNAFSERVIPALVASWDFAVKTFNEQIIPALSASWDWFTQQASETWTGLTDWLSNELPSIVSGAFDSITGFISDQWGESLKGLQPVFDDIGKAWESFVDSAKGGWDALIHTFTSLYNGLKELPVIGTAIKAAEEAVIVAKEAAESAKKTADSLVDSVSRNVIEPIANASASVIDGVKEAHSKAVDWTSKNIIEPVAGGIDKGLGYISSKYEGGIGSAHKDNIGSAYGKFQFNTTGGLPRFLKDNPEYAAELAQGGEAGSAGFNKKWEEIAKRDPKGFLAAQDAAGKKQYFYPAMAKANELGFDTKNRGIQEAMFSGAVQHGKWNSKVLPGIAKKYDLKSMSAEDQLKAIYKERRAYASKTLSGDVLKGVLGRYDQEEIDTAKLSVVNGNPHETNQIATGDLKIKSQEALAGGKTQQGTLDLAKAVQGKYGDEVKYFSAFNDTYHQKNSPESGHTKGLKFDLALNDPKKSEEMKANIEDIARSAGVNVKVLNEYIKPSSKATGGHLDVGFASKEEAEKFSMEFAKNTMPKAVQPVSAMPSLASISPIPSVIGQTAKMPEMPSIVLPLSNSVKSSPTTIIPDVGQTVSDQHIAMISFPYATSMGNNK